MADIPANADTVQYQILIEATKALTSMSNLLSSAGNLAEQFDIMTKGAQDFSSKSGISLENVTTKFKQTQDAAKKLQQTLDTLKTPEQKDALLSGLGPIGPELANLPNNPFLSGALLKQLNSMLAESQRALDAMAKSGEQVGTSVESGLEKDAAAASNFGTQVKTSSVNMKDLVGYLQAPQGQTIIDKLFFDLQSGAPIVSTMANSIKQLGTATGASTAQIGNTLQATINGMGGVTVSSQQTKDAIKQVNDEMKNTASGTEESSGRMMRSIDVVRIAAGALVAMIIGNLLHAIQQTFSEGIKLANDYANALYQIHVAQDVLAQRGIDISQKDLLDTVKQISKEFGVFSDTQMTDAVAQAALLTQNFKFTKEQIGQVVQVASTLAIQSGDIKSLGTNIEQLTRGLTTGSAPAALSKLGIDIKAGSVEMKEMETALYGTTKGLDDQQIAAAALDVIMKHLNPEMKDFSSFQDTLPGKQDATTKAWDNFLQRIFLLAGPALMDALTGITNFLSSVNDGIDKYKLHIESILTYMYAIGKVAQALVLDPKVFLNAQDLAKIFKDAAKSSADEFNKLNGTLDDTAVAAQNATKPLIDLSDVNFDSLINAIQSLADRLSNLDRKAAEQSVQDFQDYQTKLQRMQEDYQINVAQTMQGFADQRASIEEKYRNTEKDEEAKFQEKLRELREHYLFDLEDALRARDARQVLRLREQYRMNVTDATAQYKLDQEARRRAYAQELADLKKQEARKLAEMAAAEALKEKRAAEDYATERQRKLAAYLQERDDLIKAWDDRLDQEKQKLVDKYNLNQTQADLILNLLKDYYGPQGYLDGLFDYSAQSMSDKATQTLATLSALINGFNQAMAAVGPIIRPPATMPPLQPHAKGGIDFANRPTNFTFGEAGPEMAVTIPLGHGAQRLPVNFGGMAGDTSGSMLIEVGLSPDLEARVVRNSMNNMAKVITRVRRSSK